MKEIKFLADFLSTISYEDQSEAAKKQDALVKSITCLIFAVIAFVLTLLNIKSHFSVMTYSTEILTVGMLVSGILYFKRKKLLATILVAIMGTVIFSYYAVSGENEGFAILWIMMIPLICMLWMGFKIGFMVSLYFQILLIVLFYTPLRAQMGTHYTEIFMTRFPILYLGTFVVSTWVIYQTLYNKRQSDIQGRTDSLTGIDNRLGYNLELSTLFKTLNFLYLHVMVFDINRLKYINDEFGHDAGDEVIIAAARLLAEIFPDHAVFSRVGGDEFYMIILGKDPDIENRITLLNQKASLWKGNKAPFLSISSGYASGERITENSFYDLLKEADRKMYENKSRYYRENAIDRRKR